MRKRQRKKEVKKNFQAMLKEVEPYTSKFEKPKKISTEEDFNILLPVMKHEFDDAPNCLTLAKDILPDYAWWFILETYFEKEGIAYERMQGEDKVTYVISYGYLSVDYYGNFYEQLSGHHARPIRLMMMQKGYKKDSK